MGLAAVDIVFTAVIFLFALHCGVRGFVREVMSLAAVILGALAAIFFFRAGAVYIRNSFSLDVKTLPEIIAFILIFLIVFAVIKLFEIMLKNIIEGIHLGGLDRVLGFVFGFAEGIIVVCLLLFLISIQSFFDSGPILEGSFFAELLLPYIMGIKEEAMDRIAPAVEATKGMFTRV